MDSRLEVDDGYHSRRFQRVLGFRPPGAAEAGNEDSLGPAGTRASNGPNGSGPDEVRSEGECYVRDFGGKGTVLRVPSPSLRHGLRLGLAP